MIIQLDPKLTSKSNSQNRGRFVLEDPELVTARPPIAAEIFITILSDLLNYTLSFRFVNITFSLCTGTTSYRVLRDV